MKSVSRIVFGLLLVLAVVLPAGGLMAATSAGTRAELLEQLRDRVVALHRLIGELFLVKSPVPVAPAIVNQIKIKRTRVNPIRQSGEVEREPEEKSVETVETGVSPSVTVVAPNGGEYWVEGETETIQASTNPSQPVNLYVLKSCPPQEECDSYSANSLPVALKVYDGQYAWRVGDIVGGDLAVLPEGYYRIRACLVPDIYAVAAGGPPYVPVCDESDRPFRISRYPQSPDGNEPPVIHNISVDDKIKAGNSEQYKVVAYDPDGDPMTYLVRWGDESGGGPGLPEAPGPRPTTGQDNPYFEHTYHSPGVYQAVFTARDSFGHQTKYHLGVTVQ